MDCNAPLQAINIIQWNSQSIRNKKFEFETVLNREKVHIAVISETWFDPGSEFRLNGYNLFRKDRSDGYGGIAIMTHCSIKAQECEFIHPNNGIQVLHIKLLNTQHLENIISIYCPSDVRTSIADWDIIFSRLSQNSIIAGDFNGHHSNWSTKTDPRGRNIFDSAIENDFVSLNDGSPTRIKLVNGLVQKTAPDITFCSSNTALRYNWKTTNENLGSDHLILKISTEISRPTQYRKRRMYNKADWKTYKLKIEELFKDYNHSMDPQTAYNNFICVLNQAADECIPTSKSPNCPIRSEKFVPKPYWSADISKCVAERRLALAKFRRNPTPENYDLLQDKISAGRTAIHNAKRKAWECFCSSIDSVTSASQMWTRMRWLKGFKVSKPSIDREKADSLLRSLAPDFVSPEEPSFITQNVQLSCPILKQELNNCIKRSDTAPGADNIPYSMIYNLPNIGKHLLLSLYNRFLSLGFVPAQWKDARIIPIPKPGGNNSSSVGLRPIALISCVCKIFHTIITRRLEWYIEKNNLLSNETTGFRRSRSCLDNLSRIISRIQIGLTEGIPTIGCFIDIEGAYNNVNVTSLLSVMDSIGVDKTICKYLWELLRERNLSIDLDDNTIISRTTGVGLPQGDPLSATLFNISTIKICHSINRAFISQYADDFVIYSSDKILSRAVSNIQSSIDIFCNLTKELGLNVSYRKSKIVIFSRGRRNAHINIRVDDNCLQQVDSVRYLGMYLDRSLKWGKHINETREKLSKFINVFKVLAGGNWGIHPKHLRRLYIAIIRSRLDYGSFLYDTSVKSHLQKLDIVQNQAMRVIGGFIKSTPIHVMESELCLHPLYLRRYYLAGKFWLKAKSFTNNVTTDILEELEAKCEHVYWRTKKIPILVALYKKLRQFSFYSSKNLLMYSMDTWMANYDLSQQICLNIKGVELPKRMFNKEALKNQCDLVLNETYGSYYKIFSDGSKESIGSGAAFYDPQAEIRIKFQIEANISTMHSELIAISEALSYALSVDHSNFVILSDSKSALAHLARISSNIRGLPIAFNILESISRLQSSSKSVVLQWIPSHIGIMGNEVVDLAARQAVTEGVPFSCVPVHSEILYKVKEICREQWQEHFNERSKVKGIWYKTIQCELPRGPWFEELPFVRKHVVYLLRLRSGHIPSNKFKHLMKLTNSPNCSDCDRVEDVYHVLVECVRGAAQRGMLFNCNLGMCNSFLAEPASDKAKKLLRIYISSIQEIS